MGRANWWDRKPERVHSPNSKLKRKAKKNAKQSSQQTVSEVYRYFDNEEHADAFVRGQIFISTLKRCREYEDPLQGDREEGFERFNTGRRITGSGSDPAFVAMAARAGILIGPGGGSLTIENNERTIFLHDAYVLCTTLGFSQENLTETFGKYCVKINFVEKFYLAVTKSLSSKVQILQSAKGEIIYKERFYKEFESSPGVIGFVKPPDKYAAQKEYRFLWTVPAEIEISALLIECPDVVGLLTRIT